MRSVQAARALESDESPLQRYLQEVREHRREASEVGQNEQGLADERLTDCVASRRCDSSAPACEAGWGVVAVRVLGVAHPRYAHLACDLFAF